MSQTPHRPIPRSAHEGERAAKLAVEADAARLRSGGRAASLSQNLNGVTPPASRASHAGRRRAALPQPRGPWPRSLTSDPLGGPSSRRKGATHPRRARTVYFGEDCHLLASVSRHVSFANVRSVGRT